MGNVGSCSTGLIVYRKGDSGQSLPNFPVKLQGHVQAQPLVLQLSTLENSLHVVVPASDGYIYIIDGAQACFDKVDLGETSYPKRPYFLHSLTEQLQHDSCG